MGLDGRTIVITSAGRDFGRSLAIELADAGAEVLVSARDRAAATATRDVIRRRGGRAETYRCDLADAASIRAFATEVAADRDRVDVLINNGAPYLDGADLLSAEDESISATIAAGATGTVLATKHFLPLLLASEAPDILTMVSACGQVGQHRSQAHPAFYAAKHAQAGFSQILSHRLRPKGVRVMALYPPDFDNPDRLSSDWEAAPRGSGDALNARSLIECVRFALGQPRDCFLSSLHFEQVQ